ncbi:MFS transporter [uncultured Jatrophihabitans sp.]|uniref:MFS transporter n=1 Tax=uncultured Jatrophihabitans sp. TaxID=1610747 RepID=UPI0035CC8B05
MNRAAGWRPVLAYAALSAANQMLWLTYAPITTGSAHHYGVSEGAIGWLAELFPLLYVVLALPAGRLVDRHLPLWLGAGAVLTAAGAVVRLTGDAYGTALAGQVLVAVAQPLVLNAVTRMSARHLEPADRAGGIAVSSAGIFAGMVLALGTGSVFGAGHLRALLLVQGVLSVLAAGWLVLELRRPAAAVETPEAAVRLRVVWADRQVRVLVGLVCVGFGAFVAVTTWLQTLLRPAGVGETAAGVLLLVMVLAGVVASATLPPVVARRAGEARYLFVSVVVGGAAFALLAIAPGLWTGLAAVLALGVFLLSDLPVILDLAERRAGSAGATVSALIWLAGNAAGLVAALVVQVLDHRPHVAFAVLAALVVAGLPLVRGIPSARRATTGGSVRV